MGRSQSSIDLNQFHVFVKFGNRRSLLTRILHLLSGFEAGGPNTPSNIDPWSIIGNESFISASTDRSSPFERNKIALRMEVICDKDGPNTCPDDGVGIYNPGFWGMVRDSEPKKNSLSWNFGNSAVISVYLHWRNSCFWTHTLGLFLVVNFAEYWTREGLQGSPACKVNGVGEYIGVTDGLWWVAKVSFIQHHVSIFLV